jgi:carbon storage regulator
MLVLTRKINESILINSTIEVRVLRTQKNKDTIGLSAPPNVPICRGELERHATLDVEELTPAASN